MPDTPTPTSASTILTPATLLQHWKGHRGLTRRTIEAFPDEQLFAFTPAPPMRSFGAMVLEVMGIAVPTLAGLEGGEWSTTRPRWEIDGKDELLATWDEVGEAIDAAWERIPAQRFNEEEAVFGFPKRPLVHLVFYLIDNEIHHRAQGYVYLRKLGIVPPSFYQR